VPPAARAHTERVLQRIWWAPRPTALALLLYPLSLVFEALARLMRALTRPERLPVPVLVVGNLVVGGAGKTPTVIAVVQILRAYGWTPGVVSRGYGRAGTAPQVVERDSAVAEAGDEPLLIRLRTGAPVVVGRDRVAAARRLLKASPEVDIVVADDGLQHYRLPRDAAVVVFDERGLGNGLLLPAGPLRERVPLQADVGTLVLYNAPVPSTHLPGWMATRRLTGVLPYAEWRAGAMPTDDGWALLRGRRVLAAAGIAAPERFFALLCDKELEVRRLALPDHHAFETLPWTDEVSDVIVTEKDAVKLPPTLEGPTQVWVAPLDLECDLGFAAAIKRLFPKPAAR
jgi:tetraacyldisaccharide 4'-kinase